MNYQKMLNEIETAVIDCIEVPREWLPERYQGKRKMRKLSAVVAQAKREKKNLFRDPRDISVKFDDDRNIVKGTTERLATLEKYAAMVEAGIEIAYDENDDMLYKRQVEFYGAAIKAGAVDSDDDDCEDEVYIYENDL